MEFLKSFNIISDIKNDNLIEYSLPYYLLFTLYACYYIVLIRWKNPYIFLWVTFGIVPLLDHFTTVDNKNPTKQQREKLNKQFRFKIPLILALIKHWAGLIWTIYHINTNEEGLFYNIGVMVGWNIHEAGTINISHEIFHKTSFWEKFLGTLNLTKNYYAHFLIEHIEGHHRNVATLEDPATSRKNETLTQFLPRSLIGGYISAFKIENKKCMAKHRTWLHFQNKMIWFTLGYILLPISIYQLFGLKVVIIQFIMCFMGTMMLEQINYIEHYGLLRKKDENGQYEMVTIKHSWNAPHRVSNYMLLKLQRHSDHHENALKPYQTLASYDESPYLPASYNICLILCSVPSVWFKIMNPLLESYQNNEKIENTIIEKSKEIISNMLMIVNAILILLIILGWYII